MDWIQGQIQAIDVLQAALASGRVHHAFIFHGPAGVGKFTTAVQFARVILCHGRQQDLAGRTVACGACASCQRIPERPAAAAQDESEEDTPSIAGAHPDLHIVTKELARFSDDAQVRQRKLLSIPVGVVREALIEPAYRAAQLNHGKIFIVDEAELLARPGQSAMLKTLEEPPAGTHIILVTSSEDRLLVTVRSRCQRVAFVPLPEPVVRQRVQQWAPQWSESEQKWLVNFACGSLGRARLAIQYELRVWAKVVLNALHGTTQGRYPVELGSQVQKMIDEFAVAWVDAHANASKEAANKQAAGLMWALIAQYARQRLAALAAATAAQEPDAAEAQLHPWLQVIDALGEAESEHAANVNLGLVTDHLVSRVYRALKGTAPAPGIAAAR